MDRSALEALQEDSKVQNVSVNTLLNQLLLTYVNYDRPMKRFQGVKLSASTFRYVLQAASEETLAKAGSLAGGDIPKTYIHARWGKSTVENCLEYLKNMSIYANLFTYSEVVREGRLGVTLSHNFGLNGTVFLRYYVEEIFASCNKIPTFASDENAVVFELE